MGRYQVGSALPGALLGTPTSPDVAKGMAHGIHDPTTETPPPGEIPVVPFTDPGRTPLLINAAGLIVESEGAPAHGAVVAHEYDIPAVVGVGDATRKIHAGRHVRVDGNRGMVEILSTPTSIAADGDGSFTSLIAIHRSA